MSLNLRILSLRRNWDSLLAAIAGILIIHYFCRHSGIGVSPDSVDYISTASNIRHHGAAVNYARKPLVNFPLGYPLLLSALEWITGKDALACGPVLNETLFALLLFLCGVAMEQIPVRPRWIKWAILSVLVLSPCLLEIYSMLWSETLFLVLLVLFLLSMRRYLGLGDPAPPLLSRLWAPALIAALACLTRYAGITLIAAGGLLILLHRGIKITRRIGHALIFGLVAWIPPAINLWRNIHYTGTATGHREHGIISFGTALNDYGLVFLGWMGIGANPPYGYWDLAGVILFLAALAFIFLWRYRKEGLVSMGQLAFVYFFIYSAFILLSATLSRFQTLDSRLLSPLLIPLILALVAAFNAGQWRRVVTFLIVVLFIQWEQVKAYRENWEGIRDAGIPGYTENDWTHSPTMAFVRDSVSSRGPGQLYSNADDAIWFLTGLRAQRLPHRESPGETGGLFGNERFWVIWFDDGYNSDLIDMNRIGQTKLLIWAKKFPDGAVYYFTSR